MQGILSKRVWRSLKQNLSKYAALMAMIVFCMVLVLSIVASADIITDSCTNYSSRNKIEDGEFVTFVPLTEKEIAELENKGLTIEKKFCLDFAAEDESLVRVFKNRKSINLVELVEGRHAENADEIVLEKRYCEEKAISIGGTISLGGRTLNICGIGMAPDYEGAFKNLGDASVDSKAFGPAWLNEDGYNALLNTGKSVQSEEFGYAYHLNGGMTHTELKETLEKLEFEPENVDNPYFKEYWEENGGKIDELKDGIDELCDGMQELLDGIEELQSGVKKLRNGSSKGLSSAYSGAKRLKEGMGQTKSGMGEVTNGLAGLGGALPAGASEQFTRLYGGARALNSSMDSLYLGLDELTKGLSTLQTGSNSAMNELYNGTQELYDGAKELYDGINELKTESEDFFDELSEKTKMHNLELFLEQKDNPRIGGAIDDKRVDKVAGLIAGVIVMILFTYVISIFVTGEIDKESSVIGTLYALGVKKRDILLNYLQLPVAITFISGVIGAFIGFSRLFIGFQTESMLLYFSMPEPPIKYPLYLIAYAVIMPPVTAFIINLIFISKKLDKAPLKLIRKEIKQPKISRINLNALGFVQKFQIRQLIREFKGAAAVVLGMFISLLLLMMSFNCYIMCHHIIEDNRKDVTFNYMYSYKYPDKEPPSNSYEAYVEDFKMETHGFKFNISVLGITEENPYFKPTLKNNKTDVSISSAMAQKFALKEGDMFVLDDEEHQRKYAFTVSEIIQYS
ncbi:MAG: ABC transporter permease, partial [Clostridia bacterium]|nr:ABC transporter permease [Clostridia bacterium]